MPRWLTAAQKRKWLMRMKLVMVLMTVFLVQASASVFGQRLSMEAGSTTFKKFFSEVRRQTGYTVLYDPEVLEGKAAFSVKVKDLPLAEVLKQVLSPQGLAFSLEDRAIVVREKGFLDRIATALAMIDVYGRVLDENGQPLAGATVKLKGTGKSTATDNEGRFVIKGVEEGALLVVVYMGYEVQEVKARATLTVGMVPTSGVLEEVTINKGYYRTTKELNTGNVGVLKAEDIAKQPVSDPLKALSGRIPGLFIQETKGVPGRSVNVQLRGQNSLSERNNPLFIVDGVPFGSTPLNAGSFTAGAGRGASPLNDIATADIESIEVLKDADATAIYGSRGANGVVLITTKRGNKGKGRLTANFYAGAGEATKKIELMNTEQYLAMRMKAFANDNRTPGTSDYDVNGTWEKNRYTDWVDLILGGTAKIYDGQMDFSGGNANLVYRVSGSYRKETTVFPGDFFGQKAGASMSLRHTSDNKRLIVDFLANYVANYNNLPVSDVTSAIFTAPNSPVIYNSDGGLNLQAGTFTNPMSFIFRKNQEKTTNLISNLKLNYEILKDLKFSVNLAYNQNGMDQVNTTPSKSINFVTTDLNSSRTLWTANNKLNSINIEPQLSYRLQMEHSTFDFLVGASFQETKQKNTVFLGSGFSSDELIESLKSATSVAVVDDNQAHYRYNSLQARVGYVLMDRYVLNLTARRDGSSRFGPGKQFGNFGAIGAAWIFSRESFLQSISNILSFGKLRGSYGVTGNDNIGDYQFRSRYSSYTYGYQGNPSVASTGLTNPYFAWEQVKKLEGGVELGFFKNRITADASWYRNRTDNQLVGYSLSAVTGFPSITYNLPAVLENSGWEFNIRSTNIQKKDFTWSTSLNMTLPKNKLVSYPNIEGSSYNLTHAVGMPLKLIKRYTYTGVNPATGLFTFEDINKDNLINSTSDRRFVFIGQTSFGGLGNQFIYKNWELDVFFSFVKQISQNYLFKQTPGTYQGGAGNQPANLLEQKDLQPLTTLTSGPVNTQRDLFDASNARYTDGSFIRLKNLSLSWSFPKKWIDAKIVSNGRIFFMAQNLLTFSPYKGLDPESQTPASVPPLRVVTAGIRTTF